MPGRALVPLLLAALATPTAPADEGRIEAFFAADKGHLAVVELLVQRGADVSARDTFYRASPLTWALDRGHREIARLLVESGAAEPEAALELAVKEKDEALVSKSRRRTRWARS